MYRHLATTLAILMVMTLGGAVYAQVYPSASLKSFDPTTGTYVYTVTCPANSTYAFGYLQVDTQVANAPPTGPWTIQGPFVGGVNQLWPIGHLRWDVANQKDAAFWDPLSRNQVIPPNTAWTGDFVLVVPESQPVMGQAATKDGQIGSYKLHAVLVPGPKPPPPPPDTTPPTTTISLDGTLGNNDWYVSPVSVTLSATDPEGEVAVTEYQLDELAWQTYLEPFQVSDDGEHIVLAQSEDPAGNLEDPPAAAAFKIDCTAPIVSGGAATPPNANGWYNSNVQINYSAMDETSGLDSPAVADPGVSIQFTSTVGTEGAAVSDTGYATDKAGNVGSCTISGLKIDKTAPTVTLISAPTGNCHLISYETAVIRFSATDSLSGIGGLPWAVVDVIPTEGWAVPSSQTLIAVSLGSGVYEVSFQLQVPGQYTVVLFAKDLAGNTGQISTAVSFGAGGFQVEWLPPISLMDVYTMVDGSTVPVKFRLIDPCNNNAYVNTYNYTVKVIDTASQVWKTVVIPYYEMNGNHYQANIQTKENNVTWPIGDYTVVIEGPGIWDMVSGPYRSRYGLQIVDKAAAKGVGRR